MPSSSHPFLRKCLAGRGDGSRHADCGSAHGRTVPMPSLLALIGLLLLAGPAHATGSSPLLTIATVDAFASSSGSVSVDVQGSFNFGDVVQGVVAAGAVVFQGTSFARFDQAGRVVSGSAPLLSDGLDATEVPTLLTFGSPAAPPAALAQLRADRVTVVL